MKKRLSIKDKLLIYFGTVIVTGFLICGLVANLLCKDMIYDKALENLARLARDTADKISIVLDEKKKLIEQLSKIDGLSDEDKSIEEKLTLLSQYNSILGFKDLALVDLEGNSYGTSGFKMNIANSSEYENAKQGKASFSLAIKIDNERIFTIAVPLMASDGRVVGIVMGVESTQRFSHLLYEAGISDEIMILDEKGNIVLHSDKDLMEESMPMNEMPGNPEYEEVYALYQHMLNGENGAMVCRKPITGEMDFVSYAPITMGWSIALINYRNGILKAVSDFRIVLLITTGIISVLGLGAVYIMARRLAERLGEITSHLDTVAQGDFEKDIPEDLLELGDEMGDAARALDTMKTEIEDMLEAIKSCTDYMNEQVEDLTEDVKKEIKVILNNNQIDEEEKVQVIEKLNALQQISDYVHSKDIKTDENKNLK